MESAAPGFTGNTHAFLVLDRSGSMSIFRDTTISGFNEYLGTLQADPAAERMFATLTLFNTTVETPLVAVPVLQVADLDRTRYVPTGNTALLDALFDALDSAEERVTAEDRAIVVCITDGEENASKRTSKEALTSRIAELEARGNWTFTYLSASPSAFADAQGLGIAPGNTKMYDASTADGVRMGFASAAGATRGFASSSDRSSRSFYADPLASQPPVRPQRPVTPPIAPTARHTTPWTRSGAGDGSGSPRATPAPATAGKTSWTKGTPSST